MYGVVGCGVRVGGNGGNPKKAESHLRRSESTQGAPGVQGGLFGVQEGAVGSQEVAGKWRCMNDFSQKVEDFSRFFEIGSFRPCDCCGIRRWTCYKKCTSASALSPQLLSVRRESGCTGVCRSDSLDKLMQEECVHFRVGAIWRGKRGPFLSF